MKPLCRHRYHASAPADEAKRPIPRSSASTRPPAISATRSTTPSTPGAGLSEDTVRYISSVKKEAPWILEFRLNALKKFLSMPMPTHWATKDLENIDFNKIRYYLSQGQKPKRTWDEVPDDIKKTFERLGIPEQERKFLASVEAQFDSEGRLLQHQGARLEAGRHLRQLDRGPARASGDLQRNSSSARSSRPATMHQFSALNSAVFFNGGLFIYVPKGVKVAQPLQAYFRINAENFGQFERTLIIADEGSEVVYMEGCTAPKFSTSTLHSAVVELVALKGAKIQYIEVELVEQRVQPRDQARRRARGCRDQVDRLQHRQPPRDENTGTSC